MNALTPEQIELLRSLPIDHYPAPLVALVQQRLAVVELSPNGGSMTIHRTPVADTLLACIDSTRERVLGEVDAAAQKLESFEADLRTDGTFGIGFAWDCDSETNTQVAADTFTAALFAATKKGDGDA